MTLPLTGPAAQLRGEDLNLRPSGYESVTRRDPARISRRDVTQAYSQIGRTRNSPATIRRSQTCPLLGERERSVCPWRSYHRCLFRECDLKMHQLPFIPPVFLERPVLMSSDFRVSVVVVVWLVDDVK